MFESFTYVLKSINRRRYKPSITVALLEYIQKRIENKKVLQTKIAGKYYVSTVSLRNVVQEFIYKLIGVLPRNFEQIDWNYIKYLLENINRVKRSISISKEVKK